MPKAGFCRTCNANVWLAQDGSCPSGHPLSDIQGVYESPLPDTPAAIPASGKKKRRWWILALILIPILVIGSCVVAGLALAPVASDIGDIEAEWKGRLADDYPGWQAVGWNFNNFYGNDGSTSETYTFGLVPTDREWVVPVVYQSVDGGPFVSHDEIMRDGCEWNDRTDALLDYIESNYIEEGKSLTSVECDTDGSVTVSWERVSGSFIFTTRFGSFDVLDWDSDSETFRVSWSP